MTVIDKTLQSMHRQMIHEVSGEYEVTFQRVTGVAPNAVIVSATCVAIVRGYLLDSRIERVDGYGGIPGGSLTIGDRQVIVMADELATAGFPVPLLKGDKVILSDTDDKLTVTRVDMQKRAVAGCIEAYASGVQ